MEMKKKLFYFLLACNFIYAQFPSASFEADQYLISEDTNNFSAILEIENPDSLDIWAFLIWLYADTSVIKLKDASWHTDSPFQYSSFTSNVSNDTLKIATYTSQTGSLYSGTGGKILDIEFDIVGSSGDSTSLEFVRFEFSDSYINNALSSNILITGIQTVLGCIDPSACNYDSNANEDDGSCQMLDECGECGGPATNMIDGQYENGACGCKGTNGAGENEYPVNDECVSDTNPYGICGGDNSFCIDCAGVPNGEAYITPCGDCSVGSTCSISDISVDVETMDNNFRSDDIVIPIYLYNYEYISSSGSNLSNSLEGLEFIISYNPDTLSFNADKSYSLINNFTTFFQEQNTGQITGTILFDPQEEGCEENDSCGEIYNYDGAFANLSFDVIDSIYNSALHESITQISLNLTEINGIQVDNGTGFSLEGSGDLSIYTSACIDPFASTSEDLNFVCFECDKYNNECDENYYGDLCDEDGIIPDSDIFNDKDLCELPDPLVFENSTDILFDSITDNVVSKDIVKNINYGTCSNGSQCSMDSDCYSSDEVPDDTTLASETDGDCNLNYNFTLEIPESTVVIFPENEENVLHLRSSDVEKKYLSDIAPGAQLAGSLVGLYPFGVTFEEQEDNPIKFTFTFNDLSRGVSEYKLLYMNDIDDLQNHDWTEIGSCTSDSLIQENFRFCSINGLPGSGLFIVMYGEDLSIDDNIELPSDFILYRNFPNPFNPVTTLEFDVPLSEELTFIIYNVNGQIIDTIPSKYYFAGSYQVQWDASEFSSGIYLIQMKSNNTSYFQKVMLLK